MHSATSRMIFYSALILIGVATSMRAAALQVCAAGLTLSAPNSRYAVQTDTSQVKDLQTGLIWQRCGLGQTWNGTVCTGTESALTWSAAVAAGGVSGGVTWRLPNIRELTSLMDMACASPAVNTAMFPSVPFNGTYWTSTSVSTDHSRAWFVTASDGGMGYAGKVNLNSVLLVRSSP